MAEHEATAFSYFMIRIQRPGPGRPATVSGVIERLGTGEKRSFVDGAHLLDLLGSWSDGSKMQVPGAVGNGQDRESTLTGGIT